MTSEQAAGEKPEGKCKLARQMLDAYNARDDVAFDDCLQQLAAANARLDDLLKYFKSEQKRWDLESKRCGNEYHQGDAEGRSLAYKDAGKRLAAVAANWLPAEPQNQQGEE